MLLGVPPKLAVASVLGYLKGKSAIHVARHVLQRERNYAGQSLWARGYFVDTTGRDTEDPALHSGARRRRPATRSTGVARRDQPETAATTKTLN
jgi:REP element-mobilizing transposase RayT